jgi:hypothetical protein
VIQTPFVYADVQDGSRSYDQQPFDDSWGAYCCFGDLRGRLQHA